MPNVRGLYAEVPQVFPCNISDGNQDALILEEFS